MINLLTKALKSKTLILNYAALASAVLIALNNSELIGDYPVIAGYIASAIAGLNILLRGVTDKALKDK